MPRVNIPVDELDAAGQAPQSQTNADATNDHEINLAGDLRVWLEVENTSVTSRTVTILVQLPDVDGLAYPDRVLTVPGTSTRLIPLKSSTYAIRAPGATFGFVHLDPEVSTDLKFRCYRLPRE
jgi:hypothetical protein